MDMELVLRQVQDTLTVMVGIQARQAEVAKGHSEWLEAHEAAFAKHALAMVEFDAKMIVIEEKLVEIEDKLNGLIGYVDQNRKPE
jgi:hypothetical protein